MNLDPRVIAALFAHAARSPSAHNTQPWVPRLAALEDEAHPTVIVTVAPDRCLPAGDPEHLDLHLALGCWIESFSIAAAGVGLVSDLVSIHGRGPHLELRLRIATEQDSGREADGQGVHPSAGGWPRFGVVDLHHRQVDRGPLMRDDPAFSAACTQINGALAESGLRLVTVPDSLWRPLLRQASLYMISRPQIFAESLDWCRLDKRDPRYLQDGLTAECLRLSPIVALPGARLNTPTLRPWIAKATAGAVLPLSVGRKFLAGKRTGRRRESVRIGAGGSARRRGSDITGDPGATAPHHVVLVSDGSAAGRFGESGRGDGGRSDMGPAGEPEPISREIDMGRNLLRTWLLFDRHGLRADVHSELKDCPETNQELRGFLDGQRAPVAAFSVGRSTTPVPRSHRRPG